MLLTYQRVWTFGAVQLHVMIAVAVAAAGTEAAVALPSWHVLSTWVGTDAGCGLLCVLCEHRVKFGKRRRSRRSDACARSGRAAAHVSPVEGLGRRRRGGTVRYRCSLLLAGAWYLAVLCLMLVDLSGDIKPHPWRHPGQHPLRFNLTLSPLDTDPGLQWLGLPAQWQTGAFELLALAYTALWLLRGLRMRGLCCSSSLGLRCSEIGSRLIFFN